MNDVISPIMNQQEAFSAQDSAQSNPKGLSGIRFLVILSITVFIAIVLGLNYMLNGRVFFYRVINDFWALMVFAFPVVLLVAVNVVVAFKRLKATGYSPKLCLLSLLAPIGFLVLFSGSELQIGPRNGGVLSGLMWFLCAVYAVYFLVLVFGENLKKFSLGYLVIRLKFRDLGYSIFVSNLLMFWAVALAVIQLLFLVIWAAVALIIFSLV